MGLASIFFQVGWKSVLVVFLFINIDKVWTIKNFALGDRIRIRYQATDDSDVCRDQCIDQQYQQYPQTKKPRSESDVGATSIRRNSPTATSQRRCSDVGVRPMVCWDVLCYGKDTLPLLTGLRLFNYKSTMGNFVMYGEYLYNLARNLNYSSEHTHFQASHYVLADDIKGESIGLCLAEGNVGTANLNAASVHEDASTSLILTSVVDNIRNTLAVAYNIPTVMGIFAAVLLGCIVKTCPMMFDSIMWSLCRWVVFIQLCFEVLLLKSRSFVNNSAKSTSATCQHTNIEAARLREMNDNIIKDLTNLKMEVDIQREQQLQTNTKLNLDIVSARKEVSDLSVGVAQLRSNLNTQIQDHNEQLNDQVTCNISDAQQEGTNQLIEQNKELNNQLARDVAQVKNEICLQRAQQEIMSNTLMNEIVEVKKTGRSELSKESKRIRLEMYREFTKTMRHTMAVVSDVILKRTGFVEPNSDAMENQHDDYMAFVGPNHDTMQYPDVDEGVDLPALIERDQLKADSGIRAK